MEFLNYTSSDFLSVQPYLICCLCFCMYHFGMNHSVLRGMGKFCLLHLGSLPFQALLIANHSGSFLFQEPDHFESLFVHNNEE